MKKIKLLLLLTFSFLVIISVNAQDEYHNLGTHDVTVNDFEAEGYILAIGGGGEGTIGRVKGNQVIAIDISEQELKEAPDGPLKLIMDARDLKFLDKSFNTAASFFTFLYIPGDDHEKVFSEVYRVLKPGGKFFIWGAIIPKKSETGKEGVVIMLTLKLPKEEVRTGYGVKSPTVDYDPDYYIKIAEKVGFRVVTTETNGPTFYLELQK
jgi:ubiquinone/menaquinone biosynthesis C-methylase UbiE